MSKEIFVCPICGKEAQYGLELVDGKICRDCEEIADPFLSGYDGGDEYDPATEMTVELIGKYVRAKRSEEEKDYASIPKLPPWNDKVEKPPYCPICSQKFKLLNMSMRILDTYICLECFNKAQRYESHKRCGHGMDDIKFHDLEQFRREVEAVNDSDAQTNCAACGTEFKDEHDYLWLADDSRICMNCVNRARSKYPFVTVKERKWFRTTKYIPDVPEDQGTYIDWTEEEVKQDPIADLTLAEFRKALGEVTSDTVSAENGRQTAAAEVYRTSALFKNTGTYQKPQYRGQKNLFVIDCKMLSGSLSIGSKFKVVHGDRSFDYTVTNLLEWNGEHIFGEGRDIKKAESGMFFAMVVSAQKIMIFPGDRLTAE